MKLTKILILLLAFWLEPLSASPYFSFKKYQVEDGLSHNTVWCAIQDSYGFIWLGTSDGLNRYDGRGNKVYRNVLNDKFSLENNFVEALIEEDQNIWVGTNSGLYIYDRATDRFSYFDKTTQYGVYVSSEIKKIIKTENGLLWIATLGQGLFIYDPKTEVLTQNSIQTSFVWDVCQSYDNKKVYQLENAKVYSLPQSGGPGTYGFTISGVAILATALLLFINNKRREEEAKRS